MRRILAQTSSSRALQAAFPGYKFGFLQNWLLTAPADRRIILRLYRTVLWQGDRIVAHAAQHSRVQDIMRCELLCLIFRS